MSYSADIASDNGKVMHTREGLNKDLHSRCRGPWEMIDREEGTIRVLSGFAVG
jgi:hypothetical protein